jgi:hypothetical protein
MGKIKKGKNLSFVIIVDLNVGKDINLLAKTQRNKHLALKCC